MINSTTGMGVCQAIAMAAVEHSPICQNAILCREVATLTRESVPLLYAINLIDVVLESFSLVALLMCASASLGGARAGGPLLFVMLSVDLALELVAISTASSIHPTVKLLKDTTCLDQLQADGRAFQETLVKLESDLEAVVKLGYGEIGVAVVAAAGDLSDVKAEFKEGGMTPQRQFQRGMLLFLPAFMDFVLAALDFFIFTASANEDSVKLRQSIVNRDAVWCLTISESCFPIVLEEAIRENGQEPPENRYVILCISVSICISVVTLVYCCAAAMCCPRQAVDPEPEVNRLRREVANFRRQQSRCPTTVVLNSPTQRDTSAASLPEIMREKDQEIARLQRALESAQRV